jgi:uncharacterized phage protein gp47/JayE
MSLELNGTTGVSLVQDGVLTDANMPAGSVLQVVNVQDGTAATTTALIPLDNTIPQNTEGTEFMSLAITPVSATSILIINVGIGFRDYSRDTNVQTALFKDSEANALAAISAYGNDAANSRKNEYFSYKMISGTTSTITFKVRAGGSDAGTYTFNGLNGADYLAGTAASHITITEYQA